MRVFIYLSLFIVVSSYGQSTQALQKIGHADWEYIFGLLPDYKLIESELKTFENQLQQQLNAKNQELESKYKSYQGLPENTPETIRKDKESELTYLQENIQKFQQEAQNAMQVKANLISPVIKKVGKAIEDVASENGYSYIINPKSSGGGDVLLYADEKNNISDLVLKKLGITNTKTATPPLKKAE